MRFVDFLLRIIACCGLWALLCYLLWRNGLYDADLGIRYEPEKAAIHKPVGE